MLAYERRKALLDWLVDDGSLTVRQAADRLKVSEVTIRGDLRALEHQGAVTRVRGGAIRAPRGLWGLGQERGRGGRRALLVAQRAAALVEDGESIVITAGDVSVELARVLLPRRQLHVATDSVEVARVLAAEPTNTVVVAGGVVNPDGAVLIDAATVRTLTGLTAVRAFVAGRHLSAAFGVMEEGRERAASLRAIVDLAASVVVMLGDDADIEQALVSAIPPDRIDHVILDEHAPSRLVDELRAAGVTVSRCGSTVVTVPPLRNAEGAAPYKIAFANLSETEVFTAEVRRSIEDAARAAGNVELLLADNNYDGETALRNVEHFIAQGADLVIEYQINDSYAYRLMHRLRLARIPVIAIDIPLPGATYFGVDNYVAGRIGGDALAQEAVRRWGGAPDRVLALGLPRSGPAVAARVQGQLDALREAIALDPARVICLDSENIYETAYRRTRETLQGLAGRARLAVVSINDATARGAIAALVETGRAGNAITVSQGADRLALEELLRPGTPLIGAVAFNPETYGPHVIGLALDILAGKDAPPALYQHHRLIRADTARAFLNACQSAGRDLARMAPLHASGP